MIRVPIKTIEGDNFTISISISSDEATIFFKLDYLDGKFTKECSFHNNRIGNDELESKIALFSNERRIRYHFGLPLGEESYD